MSPPASDVAPPPLAAATRSSRGTVLVIDTDPDVAQLLEVRLARDGYDVLLAETGDGGLHLADQQLVDVVLLDRNLADRSSLELLRSLRSTPTPCEVIVMTVDPTVEIFVEALEAGAFDLVVKPFSHLSLVTAKVRNAADKVRAERARDELSAKLEELATQAAPTTAPLDAASATPTTDAQEHDAPPAEPAGRGSIEFSGVDPVTRLPNRAAADRRFYEETSRALRYGRPLTVAFLSLDHLDAIVETAGHPGLDAVLADVAALISKQIREVDFLARRQGGEFMLLLPETLKADGAIVAERIRGYVSDAGTLGAAVPEGPFRLTASMGLACLPTDTMNAELLRQAGEVALVRAETTGDTVVVFEARSRR